MASVTLHRQVDYRLRPCAGFDIQMRLLPAADAVEKVPNVRVHHGLGLVHRNANLVFTKLRFVRRSAHDIAPEHPVHPVLVQFRLHQDVVRRLFEHAMIHHHDGAVMPADQAGNVLAVGH